MVGGGGEGRGGGGKWHPMEREFPGGEYCKGPCRYSTFQKPILVSEIVTVLIRIFNVISQAQA